MQWARLKCYYQSSNSKWLKLGPMKIQINSQDFMHLIIKDLLYNHECDQIKNPLPPYLHLRTNESHKKPDHLKHYEWTDVRAMKK